MHKANKPSWNEKTPPKQQHASVERLGYLKRSSLKSPSMSKELKPVLNEKQTSRFATQDKVISDKTDEKLKQIESLLSELKIKDKACI